MNLLDFTYDHPFLTGLIAGAIGLVIKLLKPYLINTFDNSLGQFYFHHFGLKKVLENGHTVVMYDLASNGKESIRDKSNSKVFIDDPLRIEDDFLFSKVTPHFHYDPKTLKIKGFFHLLSKEAAIDKYYKTVYEGKLVQIKHIPAPQDENKGENKS
ncbi:hypothetical protein ACQWTT_001304 [Acinetobacter baumannii]